jgi:hypothetical protein
MIWFVDTSALVKRYIKEEGSEWLRSEIARHDSLDIATDPDRTRGPLLSK